MDHMENRHMSWLLALTLRCLGGHTRLSPHWPAPCSSGPFNGSFVLLEVMTKLASFHNSCIYVIYIVSQVPGLRVKWWYWTIYFDGDCVPSCVLPPAPPHPWCSEPLKTNTSVVTVGFHCVANEHQCVIQSLYPLLHRYWLEHLTEPLWDLAPFSGQGNFVGSVLEPCQSPKPCNSWC